MHRKGDCSNDEHRDEHERRPGADAFPIVGAVKKYAKQTEQITKQHRANAGMIPQQSKDRISAQQEEGHSANSNRRKAAMQLELYTAAKAGNADDAAEQDQCSQCRQVERFTYRVLPAKHPLFTAANLLFNGRNFHIFPPYFSIYDMGVRTKSWTKIVGQEVVYVFL